MIATWAQQRNSSRATRGRAASAPARGLAELDNPIGRTNTASAKAGQACASSSMSDPLPMFFITQKRSSRSAHPNAAKLYASWFLSRSNRGRIGVYPRASEVPPPTAVRFPAMISPMISPRSWPDERQLAKLRQRFETYTGTVANEGRL